jgi:hypothetical protein
MKKTITFLSFLLLSVAVQAQLIDAKSLKGSWKEVVRIQNGQRQRVNDTVFFEFLSSNLCVWGKTTPSAPRLRAKLTGTTLEIGPHEFEIMAIDGDWMKLSGQDGLEMEFKRFSSKKLIAKRNINSNNLKFKPAAAVKIGNVPDKIEPLVGIWKCYKRTSDHPIDPLKNYRIIRLVEIVETGDVITGKFYGFDDLETKPSWIVQQYENGILSTAGTDERPFKVINCQVNELIIANEGIVYYMNKL